MGVRVTLPWVQEFRDRHGKIRRYFRRPGFKALPLPGVPGSPEFIDAYHAALARKEKEPIGTSRNAPGSLASAISLYLGSAIFTALAPDTRRTRKNELERFRSAHGDKRIAMLDRAAVERMAKRKGPGSARNFLKALSPFLDWCVTEGLTQTNPALGIKRPIGSKDGYKTWTEDHVERYRAQHPVGTKARLALELLVNTGAARVDIVAIGRQHVRAGILTYHRHKTGVLVRIPMLDGLRSILDETKASERLTFLLNEYGRPYSKEGFGNQFRQWCNEAGIPNGYSAHGVRKYAAVLRANLGATVNELMAWFGWLTEREATRYTRDADRLRLAIGLGQRVNVELSNLRPDVSNLRSKD